MGVYLPNMEMPTRCGRCDMCVPEADGDIDWHNMCCITVAGIVDVGEKMEDCPLVPVPPHGRLIDADALIRELEITEEDDHNGATLLMAVFLEALKSAPTVIDAEEEWA